MKSTSVALFSWLVSALNLISPSSASEEAIRPNNAKSMEMAKPGLSRNESKIQGRVLQDDVLAFVNDETLRTPKMVETAFHAYAFAKHKGGLMEALNEANLNGDDIIDENEIDRFIFVVLYFFHGGEVESYETVANLYDQSNIAFLEISDDSDRRKLIPGDGGKPRLFCLRVKIGRLLDVEVKRSGVAGDPHFTTFNGFKLNYDGICDLVLLANPFFAYNTGLEIHGRTDVFMRPTNEVATALSAVAIRIGTDILEVHKDGSYVLNGIANASLPAEVGGDYSFTILKERSKICYGPGLENRCAMATKFDITSKVVQDDYKDVFSAEHIYVFVHRGYIDVSTYLNTDFVFGSTGMMGTFPINETSSTDMVARDHITEFDNEKAFGEEWQVNKNAGDSVLFQEARDPQFPSQCFYIPKQEMQSVVAFAQPCDDA